jgi:hypothetical protein
LRQCKRAKKQQSKNQRKQPALRQTPCKYRR